MSTPHSVPPNDGAGLRIGDTERIAAATALGDHFAAGRLDQAELDDRLARAYAAKTYADLRPLFADLPDPNPTRTGPAGSADPDLAPAWTWSSGTETADSAAPGSAGSGFTGAGTGSAGPPWMRVDWRRHGWMWRHPSPVVRVAGVLVAALVVMAVLSAVFFVILPVMLVVALLALLTGGPLRHRHHWQRRPIGRPPWGGDNAAWYQFGWSGRDWSHLTARNPRPGGNLRGPDYYAHRHHSRRRRG